MSFFQCSDKKSVSTNCFVWKIQYLAVTRSELNAGHEEERKVSSGELKTAKQARVVINDFLPTSGDTAHARRNNTCLI